MKHSLTLVAILLFVSLNSCQAFTEEETIIYWLQQVASGVTEICEPIGVLEITKGTFDYFRTFGDMRNKDGQLFVNFVSATYRLNKCMSQGHGFPFDTKKVAYEVIGKVLTRKQLIINTLPVDLNKFPNLGFLKYKFVYSMGHAADYLGYVQARTVAMLITSGDFRFEKEAEELNKFAHSPSHNYSSLSRLCIPDYTKKYIELCKQNKEKPIEK